MNRTQSAEHYLDLPNRCGEPIGSRDGSTDPTATSCVRPAGHTPNCHTSARVYAKQRQS